MRRLLVACLLLGACGTGAQRVATTTPTSALYLADAPTTSVVPAPTTVGPKEPMLAVEPTTTTTAPAPEPTTTTTEPPRPPVTAASRSRGAPNCGGWLDLVAAYDWPTDTACRILLCESKGDADAVNASSGATGLFQILRGPADPAENVALAYDMWRHRGWQPWVCK